MQLSLKKYEKRKAKYYLLLKKQQKDVDNINILKLIILMMGVVVLIISYTLRSYQLFYFNILVIIISLCYLSYLYIRIENKNKYITALYEVNEASIKRLSEEWKNFKDVGKEFIDEKHNYSSDLNIFGQGSLFQWINATHTYVGRNKLKEILTEKPLNDQNIYDKQLAVKELAHKIGFRQRFESEGKIGVNGKQNPKELFLWVKERNNYIIKKSIIWVLRIFSLVTAIASLTLLVRIIDFMLVFVLDINRSTASIFYLIPYYIPISLIFLQCIVLRIKREERVKDLLIAEKYNNDIKIYKNMLRCIEKNKFKSNYIMNLYEKIYDKNGQSAFKKIEVFSRICEVIANRHNMIYPILNSVLMIEYHLIIAIECWKKNFGDDLENWINAIAELEALCSISIIKYNNPYWCTPNISSGLPKVIGKNVAHPLIGKKRVCNNFKIENPYEIMLITGSNMSGKSTFMRTVGINIVLSYAGAPVCADEFYCTIMDIYACMNVSDNLEQSISSFYAEILKIRNIVKASNGGEKVLFLLDEIFKGTNSEDRHIGAKALVKQLSKPGNIGLISTHDLALSEIENNKNLKVKNYHFSEHYRENKIYFDYKLKVGVSNTRNAVYLMKLAGIEIEEDCNVF